MTSIASDTELWLDWLDALLILRRGLAQDGRAGEMRWLIEDMKPGYCNDSHKLVQGAQSVGDAAFELSIGRSIASLPKIERVEAWTYAAAGTWFNRFYPGNAFEHPREAFQHLCFRLGCWFTNTPNIRERWRLIDFRQASHLLPNACFETRPKCKLCSQPVATGSGAWVNPLTAGQTRQDSKLITPPQFTHLDLRRANERGEIYRDDLHEECARYIHRVMIPQVEELKRSAANRCIALSLPKDTGPIFTRYQCELEKHGPEVKHRVTSNGLQMEWE